MDADLAQIHVPHVSPQTGFLPGSGTIDDMQPTGRLSEDAGLLLGKWHFSFSK